jgi:hypothetical protein
VKSVAQAQPIAGSALALESLSMQGSKVAATALAGALLALGGAPLAAWWLALVYLLGLGAALRARRRILGAVEAGSARRRPAVGISLLSLVRSGWSTAVRTPVVRATLLITVAMNLLVFPYQALLVVIAGQLLGVGPERMGVLAGADGIGAMAMSGLLAFRLRPARPGRVFLAGALTGAALLVALVPALLGAAGGAGPLLRRVRRDAAGADPAGGGA